MKALIIGAGGFVGSYLINELSVNRGWNVCATKLPAENISSDAVFEQADLDILDEEAILTLINSFRPDYIFHLAAQSSVAVSWKKPALTVDINIKGSINLLEAVRKSELDIKIIFIGSGEEYGYAANTDTAISEEVYPEPGNIYAVTKFTQNMIGGLYSKAYNMNIVSVRAFNHIGPRQSSQFVASDFCKQAAEIETGKREPVIYVGNLAARRDFTDVRDIVRAYAELALHGRSGETYNVGSGKAVPIQSVLDCVCELSDAEIEVKVDPAKLRPVDVPVIEPDISKITKDTGWKPEIDIRLSIKDILDCWRKQLGE